MNTENRECILTEQEITQEFLNAQPIIGFRNKLWKERTFWQKCLFWKKYQLFDKNLHKHLLDLTIDNPNFFKETFPFLYKDDN